MPADVERGSVVLIHACKSAATRRVSFTAMLTASDLIRYCPTMDVPLLPGFDAPGVAAAGGRAFNEPVLVAPLGIPTAPPHAASNNVKKTRLPDRRARAYRFFDLVVVIVCNIDPFPPNG